MHFSSSGVKEYSDDRIGTQARDSMVHHSDIGAGACKCGKPVEVNEKFCTECGGRLG